MFINKKNQVLIAAMLAAFALGYVISMLVDGKTLSELLDLLGD